ncbi:hypothetical protein EON65_10920 [archaeon]|nr:MAG: hypothetical protein EON65_10920 [archaeon]
MICGRGDLAVDTYQHALDRCASSFVLEDADPYMVNELRDQLADMQRSLVRCVLVVCASPAEENGCKLSWLHAAQAQLVLLTADCCI